MLPYAALFSSTLGRAGVSLLARLAEEESASSGAGNEKVFLPALPVGVLPAFATSKAGTPSQAAQI